jgi:2-methylcitrate dehydratase PrpD
MSTAAIPVENANREALPEPLAARIAKTAVSLTPDELGAPVTEKVKTCLFDLIGCAFESRDPPWSLQAKRLLQPVVEDGASVIGASEAASYADAAFANAVMGHGLVREDMHSGSVSHLGIVILPTLLALSQYRRVTGREFVVSAAVGYEVGGRVGRAAMSPEIASIQYNVAAALMKGSVSEDNFSLLDDPQLHRLISTITMQVDDDMTRAYPGKQGGEVEVIEGDGA